MNPLALLASVDVILAQLKPLVNVGGSVLLSWAVSFLIIAAVVSFIVWLVTKFAGPPSIPEGARWIVWVIVGIALLIFIFMAFGIGIP